MKLSFVVEDEREGKAWRIGFRDKVCTIRVLYCANICDIINRMYTGGANNL